MKKTLLRSLLIGATTLAPMVVLAGGVEVESCCKPPRVDIPDLREGWGFSIEGSALRGYNNNLNYELFDLITATTFTDTFSAYVNDDIYKTINPNYAFGLRVGANYTIANSGNMIKLFYEHLFHRTASNDAEFVSAPLDDFYITAAAKGSVELGLDGITLLSEQHILIGPYWETTLSGGLRFAHVSQKLHASEAAAVFPYPPVGGAADFVGIQTSKWSMQFNGVGPLVGLGTMFHVWDNIAIGAEAQGALLMGRNKIGVNQYFAGDFLAEEEELYSTNQMDSIYSIVPEMFYRIYANYFYRFQNGSELQVEAGWRANNFFNLRTFNTSPYGEVGVTGPAVNTSTSDDIGFSGPYLMLQYHI